MSAIIHPHHAAVVVAAQTALGAVCTAGHVFGAVAAGLRAFLGFLGR